MIDKANTATDMAMSLVLEMLTVGIARLEHSGSLVEFCFNGLRYSCADQDWTHLVNVIGWNVARDAIAKARGTTFSASIEYRDIPGFPGYRAGTDGSVWRTRDGEWRQSSVWLNGKGYPVAKVSGGTHMVHQLVLTAFAGPRPSGMQCCHNNGVKTDNRLCNLRWDTQTNNQRDRFVHGTDNGGNRNGQAKLTREQRDEIRVSPLGSKRLGRKFCVSPSVIIDVRKGRSYKKDLMT